MAKTETKPEVVEVPKEEYDEMVRTNQENSAMITQLVDKLDRVESAQLAGVGIDPKIAARTMLPRRRVQFNEHYSRCAVPSDVQKGAIVIPAFAVSAGDLVDIKEDEFKRINEDFPGKMETNPNKFKAKRRYKAKQVLDERTGKTSIERVKDPQPVEVLEKLAYKVG